mgnify:CR=1 FL=1
MQAYDVKRKRMVNVERNEGDTVITGCYTLHLDRA